MNLILCRFFSVFILTVIAACLVPWRNATAQASIDEGTDMQLFYASPAGSDANDGLSAEAPKSLNGAIAAGALLASKIILLDGDYRQSVVIPSGTTTMILEALHKGKAVLSGSDLLTNWSSMGGGLFSIPWMNDWGLVHPGFSGAWLAENRRTEMVFIAGVRLVQRCDASGAAVAKDQLGAGEFTVDEVGNQIIFRPPSGVVMSNATELEVTMRGNADDLFKSQGRSNLVLRGMVFRHHGGAINQKHAVRLEGASSENPAQNLRIEDCDFVENNGVGIQIGNATGISLLRIHADRNGSRGFGIFGVKNLRAEDSTFNANNWRTGRVNAGHDAAGVKIFDGQLHEFTSHLTENVLLLRCAFKGNFCVGLWQDYGGKRVTVDSCLFENNEQGGIFYEMTPGPMTVQNSVVRQNGVWGIQSYGGANLKIHNNVIYGTRTSTTFHPDPQYCPEISLVLDNRQNTAMAGTDPANPGNTHGHFMGLEITENIIQAINHGGHPIFYATDYGDAKNPYWPAKKTFVTTVISNKNQWWRASGAGEFTSKQAFLSGTIFHNWRDGFSDIPFAEWQLARGQDTNSTFAQANVAEVPDPTMLSSSAWRDWLLNHRVFAGTHEPP